MFRHIYKALRPTRLGQSSSLADDSSLPSAPTASPMIGFGQLRTHRPRRCYGPFPSHRPPWTRFLMARTPTLLRTRLPASTEVLLLVDVINPLDFPKAREMLGDALLAAHAMAVLKRRYAQSGKVTIYANDNYGTWHSEFGDILSACQALPGPRGEIAKLLAPSAEDLVILKPQHSAFHSTPLQHLLIQMQARQLTIAGLATDMCVMLTATDARMRGYPVWVPQDCTAAESASRKNDALRQLHQAFACRIQRALRGARPRKPMARKDK